MDSWNVGVEICVKQKFMWTEHTTHDNLLWYQGSNYWENSSIVIGVQF